MAAQVNPNTNNLVMAFYGLLTGLPVAGVIMLAVVGFILGAKGSPVRALAYAFLAVLLFAVIGSVVLGLVQYLWANGGNVR
jgi:hypothetical protein